MPSRLEHGLGNSTQFTTFERGVFALNAFLGKLDHLNYNEFIEQYANAVRTDLQNLISFAGPYFYLFDSGTPFEFEIVLDDDQFGIDAFVDLDENRYIVGISIGAVLSIDNASCIWSRKVFPDADVMYDQLEEFENIEPQMFDYKKLMNMAVPGGAKNLIYAYPVIFKDVEQMEFQITLANFALVWMFLHEVGHIQLGHFNLLEQQDKLLRETNDKRFRQSGEFTKLNHETMDNAMELAADVYANNKFLSTYFRSDAIKHVLPESASTKISALSFLMLAGTIPVILLHRLHESFAGGGRQPIGAYPNPKVRLFNFLACISYAADNNRRFFSPMYQAGGHQDPTIELSLPELAMIVSKYLGVADEFLRAIYATPILPWKITPGIEFLEEGNLTKARYEPMPTELFFRAQAEITAAVAFACSGYAQFSDGVDFADTYEKWRSITEVCDTLWPSPDPSDPWHLNRWNEAMTKQRDLHVPLTTGFFNEVEGNNPNRIEEKAEQFKKCVEAINMYTLSK